METFYLIIICALFLLAISDLVVGVSNDAVNFLNAAVGSRVARMRVILGVAAVGVIVGCTFSSGMMEVARKGIFHPQYFTYHELILVFLAVMVADVLLLDTFNTFGMPTSTTVSIVFELLGAAVAMSLIKIATTPDALQLADYINTGKALAIIAGILLSVVVAFSVGLVVQAATRVLFSFRAGKGRRWFTAAWGGFAIACITYFLLVKGAKGASFMDAELKSYIKENTWSILFGSFLLWTVLLQLVQWFTRWNILRFIVLIGTFSLAMAFAGNDLVNFIGVPLAGYHAYGLWQEAGAGDPHSFLMGGLAGKVPTPTLLLLLAGGIMTVTLWTSRKARSVVKTSLDLGRQEEGAERFTSFAISRTLVRNVNKVSKAIGRISPTPVKTFLASRFDDQTFREEQAALGAEAPNFDLIRASVTLVVASVLIALGTSLKLPLSTTYVTFMVFMGTSLADGAWGRESAVYRISGVLSVILGWFFTAMAAFTVAFVLASIFHFGGAVAIVVVLAIALYIVYHSHRHHQRRAEERAAEEDLDTSSLTLESAADLCASYVERIYMEANQVLEKAITGLVAENLPGMRAADIGSKELQRHAARIQRQANSAMERMKDEQLEAAHLCLLVSDYLNQFSGVVRNVVKPSHDHVDNHHKPLVAAQTEELRAIQQQLRDRGDELIRFYQTRDPETLQALKEQLSVAIKLVRAARKAQIKRIKAQEVGTRNSVLYLGHLGEFRNLLLMTERLAKVLEDILVQPAEPAP